MKFLSPKATASLPREHSPQYACIRVQDYVLLVLRPCPCN